MMPDLVQYMWIVWLVFIVICVIIEVITLEFTFLMIAIGSVGGLGTHLAGGPWWLQIIIAGVLAVLLLFIVRPVLLRATRKGADLTPSNLDALSGMAGRVLIALGDNGGQVKLANGETWTAILADDVWARRHGVPARRITGDGLHHPGFDSRRSAGLPHCSHFSASRPE